MNFDTLVMKYLFPIVITGTLLYTSILYILDDMGVMK